MFGNDKKKLEKKLEELESISIFERGHKQNEEIIASCIQRNRHVLHNNA